VKELTQSFTEMSRALLYEIERERQIARAKMKAPLNEKDIAANQAHRLRLHRMELEGQCHGIRSQMGEIQVRQLQMSSDLTEVRQNPVKAPVNRSYEQMLLEIEYFEHIIECETYATMCGVAEAADKEVRTVFAALAADHFELSATPVHSPPRAGQTPAVPKPPKRKRKSGLADAAMAKLELLRKQKADAEKDLA
jgi:hypothetical protein